MKLHRCKGKYIYNARTGACKCEYLNNYTRHQKDKLHSTELTFRKVYILIINDSWKYKISHCRYIITDCSLQPIVCSGSHNLIKKPSMLVAIVFFVKRNFFKIHW